MSDSRPQGLAFLADTGGRAWVNEEAARLLRLPAGAMDPDVLQSALDRLGVPEALAAAEGSAGVLQRPDDRIVSVVHHAAAMPAQSGQLWVFTDITEQRRTETELRASEDRYRELFENNPLPAWVYDLSTLEILAVNAAAVLQYGYSRDQFLSMKLTDVRPESEIGRLKAALPKMHARFERTGPWLHRKQDGTIITVEITSHEVNFSGCTARLAMIYDITERSETEQEFRQQQTRWQLALQGSNDGLWDYDVPHREVFFSRRWKEMLGYDDEELPNRPEEWNRRVHPDDLPEVQSKLDAHLSGKSSNYTAEYRLQCKDGSYKWVLARGQAVWDQDGNPMRLVGSHTDITERKRAEEQLTRDALYDSLTGLLNRRHFLERLDHAIERARVTGRPLSLAMGDFDYFKIVNDTHGHVVGDEVLAALGEVGQSVSTDGIFTGRLGGDEFCLVVPDGNLAKVEAAAERMRGAFCARMFHSPRGGVFAVNITFGAAEWKPGMTSKALLEASDESLYRAKGRLHVQPEKRAG